MPEATPFIRPGNDRVRRLVRQRIADGRWRVDAATGVVFGESGRALRGKRNTSGYVQYSFRDGMKSVVISAHIVIWEYAHGPIAWPMQVNHMNGVKYDNRLANLELLTPSDNTRHACTTLRIYERGVGMPNALLDDDKVREIRRLRPLGLTQQELADRFGVSRSVISDVCKGRSWRHVE